MSDEQIFWRRWIPRLGLFAAMIWGANLGFCGRHAFPVVVEVEAKATEALRAEVREELLDYEEFQRASALRQAYERFLAKNGST